MRGLFNYKYVYLNIGLLFWLLVLLALVMDKYVYVVAGSFAAVMAFYLHIRQENNKKMFGKKMQELATVSVTPISTASEPTQEMENHERAETVISSGVCVEGNITATGKVLICGEVKGNIYAEEGSITISRAGRVEGDIVSKELIIDGCVLGECKADILTIRENACVTGALVYKAFSVHKGGRFTGKAEEKPGSEVVSSARIIDLPSQLEDVM
ncbi:bactofilin family protein [Chania multitudinisentens]|uniref:bactofilin family protein n=1 Tax=Chania multitudinisentens TaxID=1639108 RepID=UPI0003E12AB8|nr:polymer-forming cytoskeletal protein [Chania multitudinisentens]